MDKALQALQREKARERVARHRALQKGSGKALHEQSSNVTPLTRIEYIQKELNDPYLVQRIEAGARIFSDRDERYEGAYKYKEWNDLGRPITIIDSLHTGPVQRFCGVSPRWLKVKDAVSK